MDFKTIEMAAKLTEKAMGAEACAANWIGSEDKVVKFLKTAAVALEELYYVDVQKSGR